MDGKNIIIFALQIDMALLLRRLADSEHMVG